ncbi:transmembrane emp24 domain-containing protein 2-like [Plasmopara halstedii]|uniref:Transmembrane emp24 domain-containing protein 2-like n=1 Tax=Plasmopara halstedii TaxID=4781 RepID=A0A0P1A6N7_PLAHL|nr:transmembrane emp24 domain-containing protein 2-like [Plasmopara halstedii]CEG35846.1 transmembrane emp24 domain-containing protein 2-like [Plasmopara halstedii]|eukprot:XP_024572215.1 transmembrane emp24 domain-containing protein 2-like [Plasmopara halstedii]
MAIVQLMRWVAGFFAVHAAVLTPSDSFILQLDGHTEECFHEYVRTKRTAFLKIGVLESSGAYDVRLKAFGPFSSYPEEEFVTKNFFNQVVTTPYDEVSQNVEHSGFNFDSEHRGGWYRFCLDNSHDSKKKVVEWYTSFDLSNEDDLGEEDKMDEQTRQEHKEGVKTSLNRLNTLLDLIRNEQDYYRVRVHRHIQTLESSGSRVILYTMITIGVLGAMYCGQSYLLHKWFSDRGFLSKRQWA